MLGVSKSASQDEIKKAYRKIALKEHPDKGGDPEKFKAAQAAFDVLGNEEKRTAYDQGGEDAVGDEGGGGGGGAEDVFSQMFGGGGGRGGGRGSQRMRTKNREAIKKVTLENVYLGATLTERMERECLCKACKGTGGADGVKEITCAACRGQGARIMLRQLGPGMVQQVSAQRQQQQRQQQQQFWNSRELTPPHPPLSPCLGPRRCKSSATPAAARAAPSQRARSAAAAGAPRQ